MANRGQLTPAIAARAQQLLGKEITQTELRLMPYLQYVMLNEQKIDPRKINEEERQILSDWRERGWIEGGAAGMAMTEEFWSAMHELLWMGYVAYWELPND